jgi:hypothetical protein
VIDEWLAIKPAGFEEPALPVASPPLNPRRALIAKAKKRLTIAQRVYANCLIESRMNFREAAKRFEAAGYKQKASTLASWRTRPYFRQIIELLNEEMVESIGLSPERVLLRMDALAEYGHEVVTKRNKYGVALVDETGSELKELRDPHLALKADELLGRKFRQWGNDDPNARVVVNIVDVTGAVRVREPIEGEAETVG